MRKANKNTIQKPIQATAAIRHIEKYGIEKISLRRIAAEYALLPPLLSAVVNGMILLINKKSLVYHGSYGDLIELLILGPLKLKPKTRRKSR